MAVAMRLGLDRGCGLAGMGLPTIYFVVLSGVTILYPYVCRRPGGKSSPRAESDRSETVFAAGERGQVPGCGTRAPVMPPARFTPSMR